MAIHRGHRDSIDIDLFKNTGFEIDPIKDFLTTHFKKINYTRDGINLLMGMVDGVKIDFDEGWVHMRKSNTEPIIRIYTESKSQKAADELAMKMIQEIKEIASI